MESGTRQRPLFHSRSCRIFGKRHGFVSWWPLCWPGRLPGRVRLISLRKLRQKLALVQRERAIESERARIAKDIHDDLGSSLSRIAMLAELVEADKASPEAIELHGRQIANSARSTVRSLDEIVWAVSPEHDTWNSLAEYLSRYASEFFEGTSVRCRLEDSFGPSGITALFRSASPFLSRGKGRVEQRSQTFGGHPGSSAPGHAGLKGRV